MVLLFTILNINLLLDAFSNAIHQIVLLFTVFPENTLSSPKNIPDLIDLEEYFSDVSKLNQFNIQRVAIDLLRVLVESGDDDLVKKTCIPLGRVIIKDVIKEKV